MIKNKIIFAILLFIVLTLLTFLFLMFDAKENKAIFIDCDTDYIGQEELSCTLTGKITDYEVSAVSSTIVTSDDYNLLDVTPHSSWEGDGDDGDIELYTDKNKKDEFEIVTFKILLVNKEAEEIKINISDNVYFDETFESHNLENIEKVLNVRR